jgi:hypothetical protein
MFPFSGSGLVDRDLSARRHPPGTEKSHMRLELGWAGGDLSREYSQLLGHGLQELHLGSSREHLDRRQLVL